MCFSLGTLKSIIKDCLSYSGGTDRPGELCYNFPIVNDVTQIVNFPTRITDCDSHSSAPLDLFISSDASIFFSPWERWSMFHLLTCAAVIVHRNHFFHLYQQDKSS